MSTMQDTSNPEERQRNLDRHWRNIRTITLHNPVAYKARVIGQNLLHNHHVEFGPPTGRGAIQRGAYAKLAWGF